jgi:DNA-binding transcriptional LysR family regulator
MKLQHVSYFLAVCEQLNFTRAAKRCNVAQPSLSVAIQRLERELGGRLFVRAPGGVQMTAMGRAVRPYLKQIADCAERARKVAGLGTKTVNRKPRRQSRVPMRWHLGGSHRDRPKTAARHQA